jgi:hypothetical protein
MNADGSGKTQLSTQPYSEHPAWSPDGSQIAYDSDGQGDGWLDLWVMNADGSDAHSLVTGWGQRDMIAPSWSPDGRYVAFTSIYWIMWEGNWYWRDAWLRAWDSQGPVVTLSDSGRDWRPDWQTMEIQPPMTWISPLPPYSRYWDVPVSWSGSDQGAGATGLRSFDVQSREGAGHWVDWLSDTESTLAAYSGTSGQRAAFRVRARDVAYNVSNWTPDAHVPETWLYAFELSGAARDVRDYPLAGSEISIDPEPVAPVAPNSAGAYRAYLSQPSPTQVSVMADGQGQLPNSTWDMDHDRTVEFVLRPPDDVVENGGFEVGGGNLAGWNLGGAFTPTVTSEGWHTGEAAAFLGDEHPPALGPPEAIGRVSDMVIDTAGILHVVYPDNDSQTGQPCVFYRFRSILGEWSVPEMAGFVTPFAHGVQPIIDVSPSGHVHVVWRGEDDVYHSHRQASGSWAAPVVVAPAGGRRDMVVDSLGGVHVVSNVFESAYPGFWRGYHAYRSPIGEWTPATIFVPDGEMLRIAADSQGGFHAVYFADDRSQYPHRPYIYHLHRSYAGVWSLPERIGEGTDPMIHVGPRDAVHVVWRPTVDGIFYRQRRPGGLWQAGEMIPSTPYHSSGGALDLVEDWRGRVHFLWSDRERLYTHRSLQGEWSEPFVLPNSWGGGRLAVDSAGTLYVVYSGSGVNPGTYFAFRPAEGAWSEPQMIHEGSHDAIIATDRGDNVHAMDGDFGYANVDYRTGVSPPATGASEISQTVALPPDLHRPTLSWLYRLRGVLPGHAGGFSVRVSQGVTTTEVFSTSESVDWTHAWVDLEPWAGETITLTLESTSVISEPYAQLTVDEVSIGSWLTPVPLAVTPSQVDVGTSAAISVTGENFLEGAQVRLDHVTLADTHWVDGETLTATVPAEMPAGIYRLWVVNPGGQEGQLPRAFQVGRVALLPTILREIP